MSRTNIPGKFPQEIWNGLVPSTPDLNTEAAPDIDFGARYRAEIRALESALASYLTILDYIKAYGVANSILGIRADGNSLEWKSLSAGTGITLTHTVGGIEIAAGTSDASANATVNISLTQPVCGVVDGVALAKADAWATSHCLGLATVSKLAGETLTYRAAGLVTVADWTASTGGANLVVGSKYFVDPANAGKLITVPPLVVGNYLVKVGKALTTTSLELDIRDGVLL